MTRWAGALALAALLLLGGVPRTAHAAGGSQIESWLRVNTDGRIVTWSGGPVSDVVAEATDRGCDPESVWYFGAPGGAVTYVPGAPAFANAPWDAAVPGPLPRAALYLTCSTAPPPRSVFDTSQVVALYGYPGIPGMGLLGTMTPEAAAAEAQRHAAEYDTLNGDRSVIAAFEPVVVVGQAYPGPDGTYASRMPFDVLQQYIDVARAHDMLVILDVQPGWADPVTEVKRLEPFLALPFVHLAIDPEYMTESKGEAPGSAVGTIDPATVNAVQAELDAIIRAHHLPPKFLVIHQFRQDMLQPPEHGFAPYADVDVVVDVDGFGPPYGKLTKYAAFALAPYAERAGIKLFVHWDEPLLTPAQIQALVPPPDLVIYQ